MSRKPVFWPIVAVFAASDLVVPRFVVDAAASGALTVRGQYALGTAVGALLFGAALAQVSFLAVWGVFGRQTWNRRIRDTMVAALLLPLPVAWGTTIGSPGEVRLAMAQRFVLCMPAVVLAVEAPLLAAKLVLGLQLAAAPDFRVSSTSSQFAIHHVLATTAVFAFALALARFGFADTGFGRSTSRRLVFVPFLCAIWSLPSTLPALWGALGRSDARKGAFGLGLYTLAATVLGGAIGWLSDAGPSAFRRQFLAFGCLFVSFDIVLVGSLWIAFRTRGHLLRFGARTTQESSQI